jgi:hypothetical protein
LLGGGADILSALCKKDKNMAYVILILALIFLPSPYEKSVFMKQLGSCKVFEEVQEHISKKINNLKYV